MNIALVAGARPQFVKAAALLPALRAGGDAFLVHTGQHADAAMVETHFRGLGLAAPDARLEPREQARDARLVEMTEGLVRLLGERAAEHVVVVGDTDSTVAGARAAARRELPVSHVEAGARSGEPDLPEERNRIAVDELATLLFCATEAHARNLAGRGGVHVVGDVMVDVLRAREARIRELRPAGRYAVLTLHRAATADDPAAVARVLDGASRAGLPVHFPVHPRTRPGTPPPNVRLRPPLPYLEFLGLVAGAEIVLTDSGGLQKEAYLLGVPCLTLREATEWGETVAAGANRLVGTDPDRIEAGMRHPPRFSPDPSVYGDGRAAERIARAIRAGGW